MSHQKKGKIMSLKEKTIAVLVENIYQDLEVWYPILRLKEEGIKVIVVGTGSSKTYTGKYGYPVEADFSADEIKVGEIDGIIIPGGYAPDILRRYESVLNLVSDIFISGKLVAAICHAGWVLASAKIVKGKKLTCFSAIKDDLINAGANYIDHEVVRDGNLITSRKPEDLPAFCREILSFLKEQ